MLQPLSVVFGPGGDLYVGSADASGNATASPHTSTVLRFQGPGGPTPGAFLGTFVTPDSGGLRYPSALIFSETDPVTRAYDGSGKTVASPVRVTGQAAIPADLVMAPPSGNSHFGSDAAFDSLWLSQSTGPAGASMPEVPMALAVQFVPSSISNLPPSDRHDSFRPMVAAGAADPAFASLDAELPLPLFVDDVALNPRN
jgi:hypothetical protein